MANVVIAFGLFMAALSVPLALGMIKRNRLYGFRTPKTLSDDRIWYPVNRASAYAQIISGLSVTLVGLLSQTGALPLEEIYLPLVLVLAVLPPLIVGFIAVRTEARRIQASGSSNTR